MAEDPVLTRLRSALEEMYGDNLDRVVLFGSRARGDAQPESDYDVGIFLKSIVDRRAEMRRLADLRLELMDETGGGRFFSLQDGVLCRTHTADVGYQASRPNTMLPESLLFFEKSLKSLAQAKVILGIELAEPAGRAASLAGLHAAQALIFERERRVVKTHKGVHAE